VIEQLGVPAQRSPVSGQRPATPAEAAQQVSLACRILAQHGHEDLTLGHVSVRGPAEGTTHIKRKGKALHEVLPDDVMVLPLDTEDGYRTRGAHLESTLHIEAYRARPDVGAVIHTHPVYSIALGASRQSLEILSHDALLFPGGVPVFDGTSGLVTTPAEGRAVAAAMGNGRAVLLRNHGILAVGQDVRWALLAALTLERAAQLQCVASTLGELVPVQAELAAELSAMKYQDDFAQEYWASWCRDAAGSGGPL
jgi:ribulose-5-phosphate 4-epimerase/fuculose-1-phosphate aldolase